MTKLTFKYIPQCSVNDGGGLLLTVPESLRIKVDDEEFKSELLRTLENESVIYFTEKGSWQGYHYSDTERDIRDNDPGTIQVYIHEKKPMNVVREFINKHPNLIVKIDEDSAKRDYLVQVLKNANISLSSTTLVTSSTTLVTSSTTLVTSSTTPVATSIFAFFGGAAGLFYTGTTWGAASGAAIGAGIGAMIDCGACEPGRNYRNTK